MEKDKMSSNEIKYKTIGIHNFGIIRKSNIEIKPLTVFIGPNNCGKSSIMKLIHSFNLSNKNDFLDNIYLNTMRSIDFLNKGKLSLMDIVFDLSTHLKSKDQKPFKFQCFRLCELRKNDFLDYMGRKIEENIMDKFHTDSDELIAFNENEFRIQVSNAEIKKVKDGDFNIEFNSFSVKTDDEFKEKTGIKVFRDNKDIIMEFPTKMYDKETFEIFLIFYEIIFRIVFENILLENSYFIPSKRFELSSKDICLMNRFPVCKNPFEFFMDRLHFDSNKRGPFYNLACEFEMELGFQAVFADADVVRFRNPINNEFISSDLVSNSTWEMGLFILYLKHVVNEGDLLIIEEPEAHLHPVNHRIFVKYMVRAINQGLKIMISTNSDYIIGQIDNMINLGNLSQDNLSKLNYGKEDILNFNDINIYDFKRNMDGTYDVFNIDIKEDGLFEDNFRTVADELYGETVMIRNLSEV